MSPRPLCTLALLLAVVLLIPSEIIIASEMTDHETSATYRTDEAKIDSETKEVNDEKYNGYGGYPGGGYGGYPGNGRGGYNGGYPGNGRGGYNGGYPGRGGGGGGGGGRRGCYYGCCYRGYYGCRRCCSYAGEAVHTDVEAKPQN